MKAEVDLGRIFADSDFGETIADRIIDAAADLLVREAGVKVTEGLAGEITKARERVIDEKLEAIITEALTKPIKRTDQFGQDRGGEPVTLNELVVKRFEQYLQRAVKPDVGGRPSYGGNPTVLEKMIDDAIGRQFTGEIKKAVDEATEQARAAVQTSAAEILAETIRRSGARL
jgi:hypothetical protein